MSIQIRKATKDDLNAIEAIYDQIHASAERGETYTGWIRSIYPIRSTAEAALKRDDLFLELQDGEPVGTAILNQKQVDVYEKGNWQYKVPDSEVMVLHTLVIDPRIKGRGLGKAFVKFYEEYALQHGCHYLRIDTNEKNANARAFYQKQGFQEIGIVPCDFNGIPDIHLVLIEKKI